MPGRFFKLKENKTTAKTEILAGVTTFMTMAYILAVNPDILSAAGMEKNALFTATALAAFSGTIVMALLARLPFALAPGMGLNAFFAYTVVIGMGYNWEFALTAVFLEGLIFLLLTFFNIRELIVNAIPLSLKNAVSSGIGLFIAFIGLQNAGLITGDATTLVKLGDMGSPSALISLGGIILIAFLLITKVKGALLVGIFAATIAGLPFGVTVMPEGPAGRFSTGSAWPVSLTSKGASDPARLEAATKFLLFNASETGVKIFSDTMGELPSRTSMANLPEYAEDPIFSAFIAQLDQTDGTFWADELAERQCALDMYDSVIVAGASHEDAAAQATACAQAIRDEFFSD